MSGRRVGYLVPEFPGQTHTWIWREFANLRRWGAPLHLISTRPPPARDRARHAFAAAAAAETFYLYDGRRDIARLAGALLRETAGGPAGLGRAARLAMSLPVDGGANRRRCLPLLAPAARLRRHCAAHGIGHLHVHSCANAALIAMLARAMGGPGYSLTINANLDWWGGAMPEKLGMAAFCVSTMRWVKEEVDRDYPAGTARRVFYAPVGVDTDLWQPLARGRQHGGRPLRLLCVGRLHESKGFDVACRALGAVLARGVPARLTILGEGPERPRLETLARGLGIGDALDMPGSVAEDAVRGALAEADIFLLPSHAEPLGVVVMEAMALKTPVIVTRAGGVREIVTDGVDGLMVPPRDPDALAAAIVRLATDADLAASLAQAGRHCVVQRFDARLGARLLFRLLFDHDPVEDRRPQAAMPTEA